MQLYFGRLQNVNCFSCFNLETFHCFALRKTLLNLTEVKALEFLEF